MVVLISALASVSINHVVLRRFNLIISDLGQIGADGQMLDIACKGHQFLVTRQIMPIVGNEEGEIYPFLRGNRQRLVRLYKRTLLEVLVMEFPFTLRGHQGGMDVGCNVGIRIESTALETHIERLDLRIVAD